MLEEGVIDWLMLPERIDKTLDEELLDEDKLDDRLLERLDERLLVSRLEQLIGQPNVVEIVGMMVDVSVEIEAGYAHEQTEDI